MFHPSRGGVRGGSDQFEWESVKTDKYRENYLGHSLMAPVGRWQKGKDLQWFSRDPKTGSSRTKEEEKEAIKRMEADAMAAALGKGPMKRATTHLTKQELDEVFKKGQMERDTMNIERVEGMGFGSSRASLMDTLTESSNTKETLGGQASVQSATKSTSEAGKTKRESTVGEDKDANKKEKRGKKKKKKEKKAKKEKRKHRRRNQSDKSSESERRHRRRRHSSHSESEEGRKERRHSRGERKRQDSDPQGSHPPLQSRVRHDTNSDSHEVRDLKKSFKDSERHRGAKRRHDSSSEDDSNVTRSRHDVPRNSHEKDSSKRRHDSSSEDDNKEIRCSSIRDTSKGSHRRERSSKKRRNSSSDDNTKITSNSRRSEKPRSRHDSKSD